MADLTEEDLVTLKEVHAIVRTAPNLLKQMAPGLTGDPLRLAEARGKLDGLIAKLEYPDGDE